MLIGTVISVAVLVSCVGDSTQTGTPDNDAATAADGQASPADGDSADAAMVTNDAGADASVEATVSGRVVDLSGMPYAGAKVRTGGVTVTTGSDGLFTFSSVPAKYDLDVAGTDSSGRSYRGLSTRAPIAHLQGTQYTAQLTYAMAGPALDAGMDQMKIFFVAGTSVNGTGFITTSGSTTTSWAGSPTATGTLIAAVMSGDSSGHITSIRGQPSALPVTLTGGAAASPAFGYVDATQATISGTLNGTGTASYITATLHDPSLPPVGFQYLAEAPISLTNFSVPTVGYNASTYDVGVTFTQANPKERSTVFMTGLAPNASGLNVTILFQPVHVTQPTDNATGIALAGSLFKWMGPAGTFQLDIFCGSYSVTVVTSATSETLTDFSALGVTLPVAASCVWNATSYPTHPSVDDFVGDFPSLAKIRSSSRSTVAGLVFKSP